MKTSDFGYFVSCALFLAFGALFFIGIRAETRISKLGLESIAPENLRGAAETFRINLAVERQNRSIDDISESESWKTLEKKLSACADRIELLREQRRFKNAVVMWVCLVAVVSMAIFAIARALRKPDREHDAADKPLPDGS